MWRLPIFKTEKPSLPPPLEKETEKPTSKSNPKTSAGYTNMMGIRKFLGLVMVAGVLAAGGIYAILHFAVPLASGEKNSEWVYNLARIAVLILGILTGAGAAAIAYRNQRVKEAQITLQEKQIQQQLDNEFTKRFSQAIAHLGHEEVSIRIGGVYALERLALDSEADAGRIVEVLCSHYREKYPAPTLEENPRVWTTNYHPQPPPTFTGDIQAIRKILPRIFRTYKDMEPDLSGINLYRIELSECHLQGAVFRYADLREARFYGTHLRDSSFYLANLQKSRFFRSDLCDANFWWANLQGATMSRELQNTDFYLANLSGAYLNGSNLQKARLYEANLQGARLSGANLKGADLRGAKLQKADFEKSNLKGAWLEKSYNHHTDLTDAKYDSNIWEASWDENTIFSNGQKGTPDIPKPKESESPSTI